MFSSVTPPCLSTTLWVLALVFASTRAAFSVYLPNLLVRVALKLQRVTQTKLRSLPVFLDARISDSVTAVHVFSCPFYCVKWGPQNLVITAPARIGFTAFNRVCSFGHPVIYDTARVITKGSNPTKSDQSGPTPFLCGRGVAQTGHVGLLQPVSTPSREYATVSRRYNTVLHTLLYSSTSPTPSASLRGRLSKTHRFFLINIIIISILAHEEQQPVGLRRLS